MTKQGGSTQLKVPLRAVPAALAGMHEHFRAFCQERGVCGILISAEDQTYLDDKELTTHTHLVFLDDPQPLQVAAFCTACTTKVRQFGAWLRSLADLP